MNAQIFGSDAYFKQGDKPMIQMPRMAESLLEHSISLQLCVSNRP